MPQGSIRRSERLYVGDPDPLRATRPGPDYVPIWRILWRKRRWVGLFLLICAVVGPALFVAVRPAIILGNYYGGAGSAPPFVEGAIARRMFTIENRMPYDVTVTSIETDARIPSMSPPGFEVRIAPFGETRPIERLREFSAFRLRAHEVVEVHFLARRRCPERVSKYVENSLSGVGFSTFRVGYRAFGLPGRVKLTSLSDFMFPEPTTKECPSSEVIS